MQTVKADYFQLILPGFNVLSHVNVLYFLLQEVADHFNLQLAKSS